MHLTNIPAIINKKSQYFCCFLILRRKLHVITDVQHVRLVPLTEQGETDNKQLPGGWLRHV